MLDGGLRGASPLRRVPLRRVATACRLCDAPLHAREVIRQRPTRCKFRQGLNRKRELSYARLKFHSSHRCNGIFVCM